MFKKIENNKSSNKILLILCFLLYFLNIASFFLIKLKFELNGYIYSVSNFDISLGKKFFLKDMHSTTEYFIPGFLKFIISFSFLASLSSLIFLFRKKNKEFLILSFFFNVFPLILLTITSYFPQFNIVNSNILFFYLFFSLMTTFIFHSLIGLNHSFRMLLRVLTIFCVSILILITSYLVISGLPAIFKVGPANLLFGTDWYPNKGLYGIFPFISCSLFVTFGSLILGVPVGVLTAVFLSEFSHPLLSRIINVFIKVLAGIPSVVFGFFGMLVVSPIIKKCFYRYTTGDCLLSATIILSIMILPTIISMSQNSIRSVSKKFLEPSLALGESKARSIFKVIIPAAKNEIISAVFLGLGRALGETMAIIMVSGNSVNMPSLLKSARFLTTAMALEFSYASGLHKQVLFSIGLVLFIIIFIINMFFVIFLKREK